jgi:putative Holliday junction resolvase
LTRLVLAFDFGLKHIGVASGQTLTTTATPLTTIAARRGDPDWKTVRELVAEWRPAVLLVGLPLNMDGTESDMSARARRFAVKLEEETGVAVELVDERLSTFEARNLDPDDNHAVAAALIARTWFDQIDERQRR